MSMSAFVSFGEELDDTLMIGYAPDFMQKLVGKLQSTRHRMVQEEAITSIAVVAGVIEKDFSQYYDGIMPLLKQFVTNVAVLDTTRKCVGPRRKCMIFCIVCH